MIAHGVQFVYVKKRPTNQESELQRVSWPYTTNDKVGYSSPSTVPRHEPTIPWGEIRGWFLEKWVCVGDHTPEGCLQKPFQIFEPIEDEL